MTFNPAGVPISCPSCGNANMVPANASGMFQCAICTNGFDVGAAIQSAMASRSVMAPALAMGAPGPGYVQGQPKSRLAVVLLALFLGVFGVHNLYMGKIAAGVIQLVLTLTGIGLLITLPWAFIEFLVYAISGGTDKQGVPLQ